MTLKRSNLKLENGKQGKANTSYVTKCQISIVHKISYMNICNN